MSEIENCLDTAVVLAFLSLMTSPPWITSSSLSGKNKFYLLKSHWEAKAFTLKRQKEDKGKENKVSTFLSRFMGKKQKKKCIYRRNAQSL